MKWLKAHSDELVVGLICLFVGVLRISANKTETFKTFSHIWVVMLIALWLAVDRKWLWAWLSLTVLEVICFVVIR